jgi:hypothetical protein
MPSVITLVFPSTRNQRGNGTPILATVRAIVPRSSASYLRLRSIYLHVDSFASCLHPRHPSIFVYTVFLFVRSGISVAIACTPILATLRLYRVRELAAFVFCPITRTFLRSVDLWIQGITASAHTHRSRSTWNQRGNCGLILATVRWYRSLQFDVFASCPCVHSTIRPVDAVSSGRVNGRDTRHASCLLCETLEELLPPFEQPKLIPSKTYLLGFSLLDFTIWPLLVQWTES